MKKMIYFNYQANVSTISKCAKTCLVAEKETCNFFVAANGYCQLGRFSSVLNKFVGNDPSDGTIFLRKDIGKTAYGFFHKLRLQILDLFDTPNPYMTDLLNRIYQIYLVTLILHDPPFCKRSL